MSAKPRVSVVIPVHNREGTISRAVDSVLTQSWRDLELIVVNDGSTDATMAIVESVSDTRLRLLRHDRNRGAAAARNTGIEAAAGAYVAFLDSDDCWFSDKLEIQIAAMEEAPPKIAATCTGYVTHRLGSGRRTFRIPDAPEGWFKAILDVCKVHPSTLIVRRYAIECVGLQDPSLKCLEDWEWLLRFLERYDLRCVPDILAEMKGDFIRVGFAAESDNLVPNARAKLDRKNLDLIVANDITADDAGFSSDNNRVVMLDRAGGEEALPLMSKYEVGNRILDRVAALLASRAG